MLRYVAEKKLWIGGNTKYGAYETRSILALHRKVFINKVRARVILGGDPPRDQHPLHIIRNTCPLHED